MAQDFPTASAAVYPVNRSMARSPTADHVLRVDDTDLVRHRVKDGLQREGFGMLRAHGCRIAYGGADAAPPIETKCPAMRHWARILLSLALVAGTGCGQTEAPGPEKETVVLLHGMGRSRASLWILEERLQRAGYLTLNFPYSSKAESIDVLSETLRSFIKDNVTTKRYHLVGHSLGNIIVRNGFKGAYREGLTRVVMLAPPNGPAHLAKALKELGVYRWRTGDSGQKLASEAFYKELPVPSVPFGVIAGDRGQRLTFDEANDGVVAVENTKLEGMADWILLHHAHTFIMNSKDSAEQCIHFLQHGRFERGETDGSGNE